MSVRPWPENMWPTPEQWLDWLLTLPREEQLDEAAKAITARQRAARIYEQNLEAFEYELAHPLWKDQA